MMPIRERIHNVIQDMERQVHLPGHIAVMRDVLAYLDSMDTNMKGICEENRYLAKELEKIKDRPEENDGAEAGLVIMGAFYNVVSAKLDDYGGNTASLATYLQGVNDYSEEMIRLMAEMEAEDG